MNTQCFCQPIPSWAMDPVYKVSVKTNETPMHLQHGWRRKAMTVMNSWHILRPWLTGHLHISGCHCSLSTRNSITKMFIWESLMCAMKKTQYLIFWILLLLIWQITSKILRYARFSDSASLFHFVLCWPAARAFCRAQRSMCGENLLSRHAELRWRAVPICANLCHSEC